MTDDLTKLFQNVLREETDAAVDELLAKRIRGKLLDEDVDPNSFSIGALVRHIRSGSGDDFIWEGADSYRAIELDLHDIEILDLAESDEIPRAFAEDYASAVIAALVKDWPKQRAYEDGNLSGFRRRLTRLWNQPLTHFRLLLTCSAECFDEYAATLGRSREPTEGDYVRAALFYIHGRMLRTATAVRVLLEHGIADEAYARCRTLYELLVVGRFISDHGDEAGRRYLDHDAVMLWKGLRREIEWGAKEVPKSLRRSTEADARAAIRRHGKAFGSDYGWASKFLKTKRGAVNERPKLEQLARATLSTGQPQGHSPFYVDSSLQVHAGITGAIGLASGGEGILAVGYSNHGLEEPLTSASHCVAAASTLLQEHLSSPDEIKKVVYAEIFAQLAEKIAEEASTCAERVERETQRRREHSPGD